MDKNMLNGNISDTLGRIDRRILMIKFNMALDMLRSESAEDLAKMISSFNKDQLINQLHEIDKAELRQLGIDINELREKVSGSDLEKLSRIIGKRGNEVVSKIRELLK